MSAISIAMSGMQASVARLEVSAQNVAAADVRGVAPRSDAPIPVNPAATPIPKVYRPMRVNLYSLEPGGGVGTLYRQITPGYISVYQPDHPGADDEGMIASPEVYPNSERVEQIQAAVNYRMALAVIGTAEDMHEAIKDVLA